MKETMGRVSTTTDACAIAKSTDLVIEAIIENLEIKQKLFSALDAAAPQ
jgi:3-hydroxyacyl-CoA dehydrogenase